MQPFHACTYHTVLHAGTVKDPLVLEEVLKELILAYVALLKFDPAVWMLDCEQLFQGHLQELRDFLEERIFNKCVLHEDETLCFAAGRSADCVNKHCLVQANSLSAAVLLDLQASLLEHNSP